MSTTASRGITAEGTWGEVLTASFSASWRLMITMSFLVGLPLGAVGAFLDALGVRPSTTQALLPTACLFVLSFFTHEVGHAAAYRMLTRGAPAAMVGRGTVSSATIIRWTLGGDADAVVALAGPVCGLAPMLTFLAWTDDYLVTFPASLLFLTHLGSLRRSHPDGAQLFAALHRRERPC